MSTATATASQVEKFFAMVTSPKARRIVVQRSAKSEPVTLKLDPELRRVFRLMKKSLEDIMDVSKSKRALAEPGESIPLEELHKKYGIK